VIIILGAILFAICMSLFNIMSSVLPQEWAVLSPSSLENWLPEWIPDYFQAMISEPFSGLFYPIISVHVIVIVFLFFDIKWVWKDWHERSTLTQKSRRPE
jgi:hypothetical protein